LKIIERLTVGALVASIRFGEKIVMLTGMRSTDRRPIFQKTTFVNFFGNISAFFCLLIYKGEIFLLRLNQSGDRRQHDLGFCEAPERCMRVTVPSLPYSNLGHYAINQMNGGISHAASGTGRTDAAPFE